MIGSEPDSLQRSAHGRGSLSGLDADERGRTGWEAEPDDQLDGACVARAGSSEKQLQWQMACTVFLVATFVFALSPVVTNYDSFATLPTAVSIVNRHTLSLDAYRHVKVIAQSYTVGHAKGHLLTSYPWAVGLFAIPAVVIIDLAHAFGGPSADSIVAGQSHLGPLVQFWSASIVTGLACAAFALLAYQRLQGTTKTRRHWAMLCGLVFAFATSAWSSASRALWEHGPSILFLAVALLALDHLFPRNATDHEQRTTATWPSVLAGLALAASVAMRPTNAIALVLATILVFWKTPARSRAAYLIGVFVVFVPWTLITLHYYGVPLQPYLQASNIGLSSTFFESVAAQLFSPSRGLFIFSPIVLVAIAGGLIIWRRKTATPLELLSAVAIPCYLVAIALFPIWWAGTSFGPRFMTDTLPFIFVLSLPFVDWVIAWRSEKPERRPFTYRIAVIGSVVLLACSVLVNAQGAVMRSSICWNLKAHDVESVDQDPARVWSWSDPQVVYALQAVRTEGLDAALTRCPSGTPIP
jgi:hypothetical protein